MGDLRAMRRELLLSLLVATAWCFPAREVSEIHPINLDEAQSGGPDDPPDWTLGKGEAPGGVKDMPGGWTMHVFAQKQQSRLGVNVYGQPRTFSGDIGSSVDTAHAGGASENDSEEAEIQGADAKDREENSDEDTSDTEVDDDQYD